MALFSNLNFYIMKKLLLLITIFYIGTLAAFAQSLSLTYNGINYSNGDTVQIISTDANNSMIVYMGVKNNSGNDLEVRAKKIELDTLPGTENYFCWTSCYLPNVYVGDTLEIKSGFTNTTHFSGDYDPWGNVGKTYIMYVFYDDANPSDSIAFVTEFYAGSGASYSTIEKINATANVYPNPAKNFITLDYQIPANSSSARFEIRNILGSVVSEMNLTSATGQQKIDISNLQNGVYFYTLVINNKAVISKKLVIRN